MKTKGREVEEENRGQEGKNVEGRRSRSMMRRRRRRRRRR